MSDRRWARVFARLRPRASRARTFTPALAFHVLTPLYDNFLEVLGLGRSFQRQVARLADIRPGETVLDVGCGTGTLLQALLAVRPDAHYVGVDPDPRVLAIAREKLANNTEAVQLLAGYGQHLPLPGECFDVVLSTLTFHHLADDTKRASLAEIRRVLKASGRFLLVDFGRPQSTLGTVLLTMGSLFDGRSNMRANLAGELPALLSQAGFHVAELRRPFRGVRFFHALPRPDISEG